ncbi:MAG: ANTAR domain-containing protein [Catonella sp.]|nr:ANTAR domain-containing protein [Catonella sp.]MDY6356689.1 ANTAR domain-containing protein [Catonella sp.]
MSILNKRGRVLVVSAGQAGDELRQVLATVYSFGAVCISAADARLKLDKEKFDTVVINTPLPDEFGTGAAVDMAEKHPDMQVILIVKAELYEKVSSKTKDLGVFVMTKPVKRQTLLEASAMALAASVRIKLLREENSRLKRRVDEMGTISRAKCLLIEKRGFTEESAHRYLEKVAMDKSFTKREVAESIIDELT